ncbi:MAG: site-2 protease family protein, partial [Clostridia bacterium]|nr:site-2 protease family protein [Clostridia bacterium]
SSTVLWLIYQFFYMFHYLNLVYAVFNMLPVPPLDGSRLALMFLPDKIYFGIMKYERKRPAFRYNGGPNDGFIQRLS